jgi:hypothetical protein
MRRTFEALGILAAILSSAPAWAAKSSILIIPLEAPGLSDDVEAALDREMREEIQAILGSKIKVMPKPTLDFTGMRLASGCVDEGPDCLGIVARTMGATQVFRATITGDQKAAKTKFMLLDVGPGKTRVSGGDLTDVSRDSGMEFRIQVAKAFGVKREIPPGTISLFVSSEIGKLDGAEVMLDDKPIEPSGLKNVAPGEHRVEVRQRGFEPFLWSGLVRPSRETRVGVEFRPSRGAAVAAAPPPSSPPPQAASPTPEIGAQPEPAPNIVETPVATKDDGPSYLLPAIVGGAAVAAGLVALVQGLRMRSIESDLERFCQDANNVAACTPTACTGRPEDCDSANTAQVTANVAIGTAAILAVGSLVLYIVASGSSNDPKYEADLAPGDGGASLWLRF